MSKAVVVQFGTGDCAEMLRISGPAHAAYCARHGFDFRSIMTRQVPQRRPEWEKVHAIGAALQAGYELVIWLDADTLIVDPDADLREAIPEGCDLAARKLLYHLLGRSIQQFGPLFNFGVVILRNTPASKRFLEELWEAGPITKQRCVDKDGRNWTDAYTVLREEARANWILQGNRAADAGELPIVHELEARFNSFTEYQDERPVVMAWHGMQRETTRKRMIAEISQ